MHGSSPNNIAQIEKAVAALDGDDLAAFRAWFAEFDAQQWDQQLEQDAAAGKLDALADEALDDHRHGRCREL